MNLLNIKNRYRKIVAKRYAQVPVRRRRIDDPVLAMLAAAPLADEPATEDELESLREGREEYRAGRTVSSDEIKRAVRESRLPETR